MPATATHPAWTAGPGQAGTPRQALHIVSGKGGTGKTTVAAALACALAGDGRRVLLCEVEGRQGVAEVFGVPPLVGDEERELTRTPSGGTVYGLAVDAEDALYEYLETHLRLGRAGRATLGRFGMVDFVTSIAPGLRDVLLTGKVYEVVRRGQTGRPGVYDAVVLDAPPTGRIGPFLNVHEAVSGLAKVGPIRDQADSIMHLMRSAATVVHLVTLLEDLPVTETEEAVVALRPSRVRVGVVVQNLIEPSPLTDDQLRAAAARDVELAVPGFTPEQNAALTGELAVEATVTLGQRAQHHRLRGLGRPLVTVDRSPGGVDADALLAIAEQLRTQIALTW